MPKETLRGPDGIKLILDSSEIYPDDPGQGTPAMVEKGNNSATYWCATGEGVVSDEMGRDILLSRGALNWLNGLEGYVDKFIRDNSPK